MTSIALYTFSGTGNTFLVADMLKEAFEQQGCMVEAFRIEDLRKSREIPDPTSYDWIGIGAPVLGFTTPTIVNDFIHSLPASNGQMVFIFRTAGDVHRINSNASKSLIRRLQRKGYVVNYERLFGIGSNWAMKYDPQITLHLVEATRAKAAQMCGDVLADKERLLYPGFVQRVLMDLLTPIVNFGFRVFGKDYVVNDDCTHCGLCIRNCPVDNIYEKNGKIKFKFRCMSCMRCVYACPVKAIHPRLYKFTVVKGGYNLDEILSNPLAAENLEKFKKPGFFDEYVQHLDF